MTKLDGKTAEEDEEEHDQRPLGLSCLHVEAHGHEGEVCSRWVKGETQDEDTKTEDCNLWTLILLNHNLLVVQKDTEHHADSDGSTQHETKDTSPLPLVLYVNHQGDEGLHPAVQRSQSKRHDGADVVYHLISEYLKQKSIS